MSSLRAFQRDRHVSPASADDALGDPRLFNLYQIITGAQGGQALDNLASQFGLTREQADSAVQAIVPALSTAFLTKAAHPGGLQDIAGALDDDDHKQAYADPQTAQAAPTQQKADGVAASIFGDSSVVEQVVQQASRYTGIPTATIQQMLPVIVSIVLGGVATAMHNQGVGGLLGQLSGGLGGLFGEAGGAPGQAGTGGFGGMFGNILGSMFGGGQQEASPRPTSGAAPDAEHGTPDAESGSDGGLPPLVQAGFDTLSKMFQPGVPAHPAEPDDLGAQISSILRGKRG